MTAESNESPAASTPDSKVQDQRTRGRLSLIEIYLNLYCCGVFILLVPTLMLVNHLIPRPTGLSYHHRITDGWAVPLLTSLVLALFIGMPLGMRWLRRTFASDIDDYLAQSDNIRRFTLRKGTILKWINRLAIPVVPLFLAGFGLLTRIENGVGPDGILYRSNAFSQRTEIPFSDVQSLVLYRSYENRLGTIKPDTRVAIHRYSTQDRPYLSEFSDHAIDFLRAVRKEKALVRITKKEVMLWKER